MRRSCGTFAPMGWESWVEARLKELGKTSAGLGWAIGKPQTDRQTGSTIAKGGRRIAISEVPAIAEYLEISQAELLSQLGCDDLTYQPGVTLDAACEAAGLILDAYTASGRKPTGDEFSQVLRIVLTRWARHRNTATPEPLSYIVDIVFEVQEAFTRG